MVVRGDKKGMVITRTRVNLDQPQVEPASMVILEHLEHHANPSNGEQATDLMNIHGEGISHHGSIGVDLGEAFAL